MFGGPGAAQDANDEIKKIAKDMKEKAEKALGETYCEFEAVKYTKQIVNGTNYNIKVKVGKEGKTFGSVSLKQVEEEFKNKYNVTIDKRKFIDKGPLDSLGYYNLKIELHKGIIGIIKVHIEEEK